MGCLTSSSGGGANTDGGGDASPSAACANPSDVCASPNADGPSPGDGRVPNLGRARGPTSPLQA
jgi:hypothetical protein